jgi:predicted ATP-grasp superfamily ATP-dependent carboligase
VKLSNLDNELQSWEKYPCWLRLCGFGVTLGKGAIKCGNLQEIENSIATHPTVNEWQLSEFIVGQNIAVSLLFKNSQLIKHAMYERLEYFAGHLFQSGVSCNISKGKIFEDEYLRSAVITAIQTIIETLHTKVDGLITVDLLLAENGMPKITEINVRPSAPVEAYSLAGIPILGDWLETILDRQGAIDENERKIPSYIYSDIDGRLIVADK